MLFHSLYFKRKLLFTRINVHDTVKILIKIQNFNTTFRLVLASSEYVSVKISHPASLAETTSLHNNKYSLFVYIGFDLLSFSSAHVQYIPRNSPCWMAGVCMRVRLAPCRIFHQLLKVNTFFYPEQFYFPKCISKQSMFFCFLTCRLVHQLFQSIARTRAGTKNADYRIYLYFYMLYYS